MNKQEQYRTAMETYEGSAIYRNLGAVVATSIVALQAASLARLSWGSASLVWIPLFVLAYVAADFINGMVHMVMDNADNYTSPIGPLVAVFHRHHHRTRYPTRNTLLVFCQENGMKNWLAVYMVALVAVQAVIPPAAAFALVAFSLLSSLSELSHYLCHNSTHRGVRLLQRARLLLHPEHHRAHHESDNVRYAFLNGMTDPLIDAIAKRLYPAGYVNTTNAHAAAYYSETEGNEA